MPSFPNMDSKRRVALCHDWLTGMRGGEKVLEILCNWFPQAPVYTLLYNQKSISSAINSHKINVSPLQKLPAVLSWYRYMLPFFPSAIESFTPPETDLLVSTCHCVAKGLRINPGTRQLCYCFTPMRYAWTFYEEYFGGSVFKKLAARMMLGRLRKWDCESNQSVHRFVAISRHVQDRIQRFYGRESDVVYPPVDTERLTPGIVTGGGFDLIVSALVPYKRLELAIQAYRDINFPLKIVGIGTELRRLHSIAPSNVEFLGWQSDDAILDLYRGCRLLVFPGEEDFGIVPVEAQACGKPVVAFSRGGVLESIVENQTGIFFHEQTAEAIRDAVGVCSAKSWDVDTIRNNALRFRIENFISGLAQSIETCMKAPAGPVTAVKQDTRP